MHKFTREFLVRFYPRIQFRAQTIRFAVYTYQIGEKEPFRFFCNLIYLSAYQTASFCRLFKRPAGFVRYDQKVSRHRSASSKKGLIGRRVLQERDGG